MATVNLGRIKPVFKGAYAGGTAYVVDDIVTSGNETFICIQASTGNATSNASYWTKLASKGADGTNGTNGTDVGTVITTEGDMLYRDGSGLQRLPKGTASQELRMNSGATAPEWHTPAVASSDFVKLATYTPNGVSQFDMTGLFDASAYTAYKIILKELKGNNGDECHLRAQYLKTNIAVNSGYKFSRVETFAHYAGSHNIENHHDHSSPCIRFSQHDLRTNGGYENGAFEIDIYNFGSAGDGNGNMAWRGVFYSGSQGESYNISGTALTDQTFTAVNGIRFYDNNGNNTITGKAIVYGIK